MTHLLVQHTVEDFAKWKAGYDADKATRDKVGLKQLHLLQGAKDPSFVTLLFEVADAAKAHAFIQSDDLKSTMDQIGVTGKPEFYELM